MAKMSFEENLAARADLFQALGHPVRLLIVNLVRMRPRHGQELAQILNLTPATISFHLNKLAAAGLLQSAKDQYYQTYSLAGDVLDRTLDEMVRLPQAGLKREVDEDAFRKKGLATFVHRGRLRSIPAQLKKRQVIMEYIVQHFEPDRAYTHQEVNRILVEFHEDVATLRRELVGTGLMVRDEGIYRRAVSPEEPEAQGGS